MPGKKRKRSSYDNKELKKSVTLCDDGKYRWIYELSMWKNPTLLVLIYKVLGIAFGIVGLFILILNWENLSFAWEDVWPVLAFIGFFALLTLLAYAIVAGMYGGKYIVIFTMDERGINHEQIPEQAAKARTLGAITAAAGAATSNPSMAGLGVGCAARTSMYFQHDAEANVGPLTKLGLSQFSVDKCFIGADAISEEKGVSTINLFRAEVVRSMSESAGKMIVLTTSDKIGGSAVASVFPLDHLHTLITDTDIKPADQHMLERAGVNVLTV